MEEKQKKQIEIIRGVLASDTPARGHLEAALDHLNDCAKNLVEDLNVLDVIRGHSEYVMAASAIVGLSQQINMLLDESY